MARTLESWQRDIFILYGQGKLEKALALMTDPPVLLTGQQQWQRDFWAVCLHSRLGKPEAALALLEAVDASGGWVAPGRLAHDADLAGIRQDARFRRLLERWTARLEHEQQGMAPQLEVVGARGVERGTLVALHMNMNSATRTRPLFAELTAHGWRLALAQSGQLGGPDTYVWTDAAQADAEAQAWAAQVGGRPFWAGLSAGGHVVVRGVLTGLLPAAGVLAVVPSLPADPAWWPHTPLRVPFAFVLGEHDALTPQARALAARLQEAGVPVRVWTHPGGHDLPESWPAVRDEALAWLEQWALALAYDPALTELPEAFAFGDSPPMADDLLALVLSGTKVGTADWPPEHTGHVQPGTLSLVLDGQGAPRAVIRTLGRVLTPFLEVTPAFAASEGEGDLSLEWWRAAHRRYFSRQPGAPRPFTDAEVVACETFEVVWPPRG